MLGHCEYMDYYLFSELSTPNWLALQLKTDDKYDRKDNDSTVTITIFYIAFPSPLSFRWYSPNKGRHSKLIHFVVALFYIQRQCTVHLVKVHSMNLNLK